MERDSYQRGDLRVNLTEEEYEFDCCWSCFGEESVQDAPEIIDEPLQSSIGNFGLTQAYITFLQQSINRVSNFEAKIPFEVKYQATVDGFDSHNFHDVYSFLQV